MKRFLSGISALCLISFSFVLTGAASRPVEWPIYGGTPDGTRYSPLKQINKSNVTRLQIAWTYDPGERGASQASPVVVEGVLYSTTPGGKLIALDAASGRLKWAWDAKFP